MSFWKYVFFLLNLKVESRHSICRFLQNCNLADFIDARLKSKLRFFW